jgi:hypothetical protein
MPLIVIDIAAVAYFAAIDVVIGLSPERDSPRPEVSGSTVGVGLLFQHEPTVPPALGAAPPHPKPLRAMVRQSADCAGRPAKVARYATPGGSVPSMR